MTPLSDHRHPPLAPNQDAPLPSELTISLPRWLIERLARGPKVFPQQEERMRFVIVMAKENVRQKTGGPFAAGVFDAGGRLIAAGVNCVVEQHCSIFHAEIMAIALAQKRLGRYDLSDGGKHIYELTASTEPCAMCFGAIPWSGITRLVCGARDEDARAIGFDEGPKLPEWPLTLEKRGISVTRDILRSEAAEILHLYLKEGGTLYNSKSESTASFSPDT